MRYCDCKATIVGWGWGVGGKLLSIKKRKKLYGCIKCDCLTSGVQATWLEVLRLISSLTMHHVVQWKQTDENIPGREVEKL